MSNTQKLSAPERQTRLRICQSCEQFTVCASARNLALTDISCPRTLWPDPTRGFGDLVAAVAQPIAGAIDNVFGTDLKNCGSCAKRQEFLNKVLPLSFR